MADHFAVRVGVRSYEIDVNGHVNHANYHRYAEHARTEHMNAAGCSIDRFTENGLGIVLLETTCRFQRELRYGDEVEIDSRLSFGEGRTFRMEHTLRRVSDDVAAAEITCTMGLLDAAARRLVADPGARLRELATAPELLDPV
ncbi:MAG: acyl-CoA thioesterase [Pseudonocardia sp.]|uniref:acyl-CoA thioesterase n=1 Tax=Pseudonocardia sp. TaxID=60912 RepID=UPI001AD266AD|nr:acyl-CoA thioesterase [Pseudonocardia sp.]MBN9100781.1 acyl-CoA thioesterase [Pseudonocardia sp.]